MRQLLRALPFLLGACAVSAAPPPASADRGAEAASNSTPQAFVCQAFVRPSVYDEPKIIGEISMSEPGDRSLSSPAFRFRVLYSDDQYEGRTLITYVYSTATGKLIEETLLQLDRQKGPMNQFIGHGFTGLRYVYAPASAAELQYWCRYG